MRKGQVILLLLLSLIIAGTLFNSSLFEYETLASYFLYTILSSALAMYFGVLLLTSKNEFRVTYTYASFCFILFSLYILAHPFLIHGTVNFKSVYIAISLLLFITLIGLFSGVKLNFRWFNTLISSFVLVESIVCLAQYFGFCNSLNVYFKVTGTQVNPNITAMFIAMAFPSLWVTLFNQNKLFKNIAFITLLLSAVTLYLLKCRTAFIGASVASAIVLNYRYGWAKLLLNKSNKVFMIGLLILLSIGLIIPISLKMYYAKQASAEGRSTIWNISLGLIGQKPMLGHGYDQFERQYNLRQARYFESGKATEKEVQNASFVYMAYNEFLENTVEGGIVGLLLFLGVIVSLLFHHRFVNSGHFTTEPAKPYIGEFRVIAIAGVAAFAVMSLVNFTIQAVPVWCLFIVFAAMLSAGERFVITLKSLWRKAFAIMLIFIGLYFVTMQTIKAKGFMQVKNATQLIEQGHAREAVDALSPYENYLYNSENYLQCYAKALYTNGAYKEALLQYAKAANYTSNPNLFINTGVCNQMLGNNALAEKNYKQAMNIVPNQFEVRCRLMQLYDQAGDTSKSMNMARSIVRMPVKINSEEVELYKAVAQKVLDKYEQ